MGALVGKVAHDEEQPIAERLPQSFDDLPEAAAIGAEKIEVGDHADAVRHAATPHVIALGIDGSLQDEGAPRCGIVVGHPGQGWMDHTRPRVKAIGPWSRVFD